MILTEFDYEKNAIINPWHTSDMVQGMPKVAVTCFSRVTFARMLSAFGGRNNCKHKCGEYGDSSLQDSISWI